uniref:Probable pectate lyase F n=1 Tax=Ditylenchus dipsaci TaxID=166011 RepID=A0A915CY33_9BILA
MFTLSFVLSVLSTAFVSVILLPGVPAPPATTPASPAAGTGAPPPAAAGGGGGGACKYDPFPTPTNCEVDKCYTADKSLGDGGQGEGQKPIIEVADGGTVSNVVFGKNAADGIHCLGSCKIIDTWWTDVGEDAATFKGKSSQVSIQGGVLRTRLTKYSNTMEVAQLKLIAFNVTHVENSIALAETAKSNSKGL